MILYPEGFLARHEYTDPNGLVHSSHRPLIGEAWERRPVIPSLGRRRGQRREPGYNVVIHEMALKLDMLTGEVNGFAAAASQHGNTGMEPCLQRCVSATVPGGGPGPADAVGPLCRRQSRRILRGDQRSFYRPDRVLAGYPEVYRQLQAFYRRDPLAPTA